MKRTEPKTDEKKKATKKEDSFVVSAGRPASQAEETKNSIFPGPPLAAGFGNKPGLRLPFKKFNLDKSKAIRYSRPKRWDRRGEEPTTPTRPERHSAGKRRQS